MKSSKSARYFCSPIVIPVSSAQRVFPCDHFVYARLSKPVPKLVFFLFNIFTCCKLPSLFLYDFICLCAPLSMLPVSSSSSLIIINVTFGHATPSPFTKQSESGEQRFLCFQIICICARIYVNAHLAGLLFA